MRKSARDRLDDLMDAYREWKYFPCNSDMTRKDVVAEQKRFDREIAALRKEVEKSV